MLFHDTIAAISTPFGKGGIALIRISGTKAIDIAAQLFKQSSAKKITESATHRIVFGSIEDKEEKIDDVVAGIFLAPHSFTGDDTVEISCHGSTYIQGKILQLLIAKGARLAGAGEFTQRAFLNGKMDLAQAEAVADLIASESAAAHRVALQQLRGGFSCELKQLREQLLNFVSLIELELDFAEEDVEFADRAQFKNLLQHLQNVVGRLIQSFAAGNAIKNGVPVAIVGATNVGKSTLLNALLGEERAIVSDIHGTTRDAIEDCIQLNGITFRFIDTAGIRSANETIEQLGIERTFEKIRKATIVILLTDATRPETQETVNEVKVQLNDTQKLIVVMNKIDENPSPLTPHSSLSISAKHKKGLDTLLDTLSHTINLSPLAANETIVTNTRHYEALLHTQKALLQVEKSFAEQLSGELIAQDIREALYHLGSITGEITSDEILGTIFSRFCIGK